MIKKQFQNIQLSRLGMGNMRLPTISGEPRSAIDYEKAQEIIDCAMANGINYYDTAYTYPGSEEFLGQAMKKYPRDSYYLATKYWIDANPDYAAVFEEQLRRLQTDHIDFYLIHSIMEGFGTVDQYIDSGCIEYFIEQQKKGRITYLGFSSHAKPESLRRMADYHKWDFAQIQLNYLDWIFGTAKEEYEILTEREIPVMVMESIRGGKLANLTDDLNEKLKAVHPDWSVASWALRWLKRLPNVQVMLSGMSSMEQIQDNLSVFETDDSLSDDDTAFLEDVAREYRNSFSVPCTGCRYCCENCPQGLNIPKLMEIYNHYKYQGYLTPPEILEIPEGQRPSDCLGCGKCMRHCPQTIQIPTLLKELDTVCERILKTGERW